MPTSHKISEEKAYELLQEINKHLNPEEQFIFDRRYPIPKAILTALTLAQAQGAEEERKRIINIVRTAKYAYMALLTEERFIKDITTT